MRKIDFILFLWYDPSLHLKKFVKSSVLCLVFVFEPSLWLVRNLPKWKVPHTHARNKSTSTHTTFAFAHKRESTSFPHLRWRSSHLLIAYRCESKYKWSLFRLNHVKSHQTQHRCAADFRIIRHFRKWIFDLITPSSSMRRKNLIVHFQRASTRVHIRNRPVICVVPLGKSVLYLTLFGVMGRQQHQPLYIQAAAPLALPPWSHFMQCCIIREKEDRVMFTYSHLWWVQENWIHAESGIIDLDGSRTRNIWGLSHTGTSSDGIIKEGWTARHSHLHQYFPVNTFTYGIKISKMFPDEIN